MALARIITRSDTCSRELAFDLLGRGYAVEVVTPDSIPPHRADLELRVETGAGDRLTASVEARDGERSASLEFVHHLKAPDGGLSSAGRRSLVKWFTFRNSLLGLQRRAEHRRWGATCGSPEPAPKAVTPAAEILASSQTRSRIRSRRRCASDLAGGAIAIAAVGTAEPFYGRGSNDCPADNCAANYRPAGSFGSRTRGTSSEWRTGAPGSAFASVVLLALVLGFGMRRTGKASAQSSGATPAEKVAASTDVNLLSAVGPDKNPGQDPGQVSALATLPPAMKSEANSGHAPKESPVAKAGTATASTGPRIFTQAR